MTPERRRAWQGSRSKPGRRFAVAAVAVLLVGATIAWANHAAPAISVALGDATFHGTAPLAGRLAGHDDALPTMATRCSNCHEAPTRPPRWAAGAASGSEGLSDAPTAVALDRAALQTLRRRRGGPPSRFEAAGLCTLLRTGVDPAQVMVASTMPRYTPTDAECADLWAYLTTR